MTIQTLKEQQAAYKEKLKGWMKNKWLYLLIYPLFIIAYYKLRLAWVNWKLSKLLNDSPIIEHIESKDGIRSNVVSNTRGLQNRSPIENLGRDILSLALSYLDKTEDLNSVAKCSATLFVAAHSVRVRRVREQKLKKALVRRNFDEVVNLLLKDRSLAFTPFRLKANPYYDECPEQVMTAVEYALWLRDEPMVEAVVKGAGITEREREDMREALDQRAVSRRDLEGGSSFDFSSLLAVVAEYERERSEENKRGLYSALSKCPAYVLDAASWIYYKDISGEALESLDVWASAPRGRGLLLLLEQYTVVSLVQSPQRFLNLLNRISSTSSQSSKFTILGKAL